MLTTSSTIEPIPPLISEWTAGWGIFSEAVTQTPPASTTFGSPNNRITWWPLFVPRMFIARRMFWANGVTVSGSNNIEAGIYADRGDSAPGRKLVTTGSVAQGTASQIQFADITDTTVPPGVWWLSFSCSVTGATFMRSAYFSASFHGYQQLSVAPGSAPATASPALNSDQSVFLTGIDTRGVS